MSAEKLQTYKQIDDQNEAGQPVTVLVKRSGEKGISVGTYTGPSEEKDMAGLYEVQVDSGTKFVSADQLTDDHQWELAEQLAGTMVRTELGKDAIKNIEMESKASTGAETPRQALIEAVPEDILHPKDTEGGKDSGIESKERPQTTAEIFYSMQDKIAGDIQRAIERAGHFDPCTAAFGIGRDIEKMMNIQGLNPEMVKYLADVKAICGAIGNSGNDKYSPYYRKQDSGLRTVQSKIQAIKKN